ncbi:MAG: glycogen/starch synthase [Paludibacteraceae bacterium]|nr:glycogen/starch synthase [Paludibacteraceae bacterium]
MTLPDYIFETSWEVCNKVGGIYAVLSTRAASMQQLLKDKVFFIGPDLQQDTPNPYFKELKTLLPDWRKQAKAEGLQVRIGRWQVPGRPIAVLVNFEPFWEKKNEMYYRNWERFGVNSIAAYGDYDESSVFAYATGVVIESLYRFYHMEDKHVVAHFNEWTTSFGLFYVKDRLPQAGTLFTTHATSIGRSIAGNGKPLYDYFEGYNGDQMAEELNMVSKHSAEKQAALYADCFTTVSDITARECSQLLGKKPDIVTPNGFESEFVPKSIAEFTERRRTARQRLTEVAEKVLGAPLRRDTLFVCTSGRYEWKNKGIDAVLHSMKHLAEMPLTEDVVLFVMVPAWVRPAQDEPASGNRFCTHRLMNEQDDPVLTSLQQLGISNLPQDKVKVIFAPVYLKGDDGVFNLPYYDLLIGMDLTLFPSYYEPWGYTPLESTAFRVPTVTTDLSGFGQWAGQQIAADSTKEPEPDPEQLFLFDTPVTHLPYPIEHGAAVVHRTDSNWDELVRQLANTVWQFMQLNPEERLRARAAAASIAERADWKHFFHYYLEAYDYALRNH